MKSPTTNDIMTALLTGKPVAPQQTPVRATTPPLTPEAPQRPARERRRYETPTRQVHREWGKREQQREARARAEEWWQALRRWQVRDGGMLVISGGGPKGGAKRQMTPVVGNWAEKPWGHCLYTEIHTPLGWISERAVARLCSADPLLSRVRGGGGLATLCDERGGWNRNGEQARAYARAVLTLADQLGDERAGSLLHQIP